MPVRRTRGRLLLAVLVLLTGITLVLGYANKARCVGPEFDAAGRSGPDYEKRVDHDVCYSDIQQLWLGRDVDRHVFPYVNGSITPDGKLEGGSVEYPVLTGLLIWAGALFAHDDGEFLLYSALLMAPFGLLTGWMLGRLARWRALVWALGPPLVLYAFHNWDLPVVAVRGRRGLRGPRVAHPKTPGGPGLGGRRAARAGLRPEALPGGVRAAAGPARAHRVPAGPARLAGRAARVPARRGDRGAGEPAVRGGRVRRLAGRVHLPAAAQGGPDHELHLVLGLPARVGAGQRRVPGADGRALADAGAAVVRGGARRGLVAVATRRPGTGGAYPWVGVSAAMLCGFLLLHKVHSPQYTLWLLPFFVLLAVPWGWVAAYLVADAVMGIGIFRWFYVYDNGLDTGIQAGFAAQAVAIGVWGRAVLLVVLFVLFLRLPELRTTPAAESSRSLLRAPTETR